MNLMIINEYNNKGVYENTHTHTHIYIYNMIL